MKTPQTPQQSAEEVARRAGAAFEELVHIMDRLRDPGGCPWDREQTLESLRRYLVEESAEALEALDNRDLLHLREELGDLLLQIVFQSRIVREQDAFTVVDVIEGINEKMRSRHPHVFGEETAETADEVHRKWEEIKAAEKKDSPRHQGPLGDLPPSLPALQGAQKTGEKAAKLGFDWPDAASVWEKVQEETEELKAVDGKGPASEAARDEELGDLLFTVVNLARHYGVDAEGALGRATAKFRRRFTAAVASSGGKEAFRSLPSEKKEAAWSEAKKAEGERKA